MKRKVLKVDNPILPSAGGFQAFNRSGTLTVPAGVFSLRVLCVGGGGSGAGAHGNAAGSGYVSSGNYSVTPTAVHTVTVGAGAVGGAACVDGAAGGSSSFGSLLTCSGGSRGVTIYTGGNGGSGGGAGCYYTCTGGTGGRMGPMDSLLLGPGEPIQAVPDRGLSLPTSASSPPFRPLRHTECDMHRHSDLPC